MNIEHIKFFDTAGIPLYLPDAFYFVRRDYKDVDDVVKSLHEFILSNPQFGSCWAFLSHGRFLLITPETFDLHLHGRFINNNLNFIS